MFYDEIQAIEKCEEEPSQIFNLINEGHLELVNKILSKKSFPINTVNEDGDDILSYLLKNNYYDLVLNHMTNKNWNVNHQNKDGETFAHILVAKKYVDVLEITKQLHKNKRFIPNIRNKNGETILDISLYKNNLSTTLKILKDKRFNNIDLASFKTYYEKYIKNEDYGVYSKMTNLEVIVGTLKDKPLLPKLNNMIDEMTVNMKEIKNSLKQGNIETLDKMVYSFVSE